ncbi:repressor protein [candidate division WOR-1 bacterium RIFOXYA12_FULL_43_27]|uniref:Repressor protein n=1 Tax=candidate division WOR-1 bacterium RIFOXYC2_FULL_46_14 TaxID=1802587 RepID=A0A1F4U7P3_UNCSA|nr:MAG: repressor protein [candidate division WOR-1 bacterium RIFOXYA12_FULL_43_27]OGC19387.1 MAG: repressor protein [candidate division WOR-1 bacterium RIFOXYB2_FULL_46_45]OGC30376.1 MAG: repressor protein [candidate division WOR-1 bacterium RIFOXYA2_FULL_46_56]OGC40976.1 MAG: repressor protein [candidate division WOR-1 bacterium RIFOXYC2_FULL_46_14]
MDHEINQKAIAARLKTLREKAGLSQEEIAKILDISRTAISQIENNERGVSSLELAAFSEAFKVSTDYILGLEEELEVALPKEDDRLRKQSMRISVPKLNLGKFKQVLLYLLERCAGKPNIGETVLYKLLYFIDFNYYETYEELLTGAKYIKNKYGPTPIEFVKIIDQMEDKGEIRIIRDKYGPYSQKRYIPLVKADLSQLKASEKEVIDRVIMAHSDKNAKEISNYSHEDLPWKATKDKDVIDYELVFYRTPAYSVRSYPEEGGSGL